MKKLFKFSLLALFLGVMSCEDATDIIQKSEMSEEEAFQTLEHLQQGLNGVYGAYSPDAGGNGNGDSILFNELFTDNFKRGIDNSGQGSTEYSFILQPLTSFPASIWGNRYATINFANRVLRAWDRVVPNLPSDEQDDADQIKGQLLALRALCHLDLMMYFTEDYQDLSSPSIIIMDFVPDITQVFPRNTVGEVYDFIEADINEAMDLIEGFNANAGNPFYLSQNAVMAIKSRFAITKGDYALAADIAQDLLETHPIAGQTQIDDYLAMWSDASNVEIIWKLSRRANTSGAGITDLFSANGQGLTGNPFFEASTELYFLYDNNDIRRFAFFSENSVIISPTSEDNIILITKYPGSADGQKVNDVKIFRSSEQQFILAEAQARLGNLDAAEQLIQELRTARKITVGPAPMPQYNSLEEALQDILLERRKELFFEGFRYLDLKRIGQEIGEGVSRADVDCASFAAPCDLLAGDYRFTLPIPRTEINANPTIQQNSGY